MRKRVMDEKSDNRSDKIYEQTKTYIYNAITCCDFVKEKLIFSDRHFLTEQIVTERTVYGGSGFNKISDVFFVLLYFFGKYKTKEIMQKLQFQEEQCQKRDMQ